MKVSQLTRKRTCLNFGLTVLCSIVLVACSSTENSSLEDQISQNTKEKREIIEQKVIDLPMQHFSLDNSKAAVIQIGNGGSLLIPENAFVDKNGKAISGEVTIEWEEFHTLSEIALSGIPMAYDSAGVQEQLVSGGMFTINASAQGKEVELAKGKSIDVGIASSNPKENFNFYCFNEKQGNWNYKANDDAVSLKKDQQYQQDFTRKFSEVQEIGTRSTKGSEESNKQNTFQGKERSKMVLDISATFSKENFPELNEDEIIAWEVTESEDPQFEKIKSKLYHSNLNILSRNSDKSYKASVVRANRTFLLNVKPLSLGSGDNVAKSDMQEKREAVIQADLKAKEEGKLIRRISIPNLGTYNWDCIGRFNTQESMVDIVLPKGVEEKDIAGMYYFVPSENLTLPVRNKSKVKIVKNAAACILILTLNNKVFGVGASKIRELLNSGGEMKPISFSNSVRSSAQLDAIVSSAIHS